MYRLHKDVRAPENIRTEAADKETKLYTLAADREAAFSNVGPFASVASGSMIFTQER